MLRELTEQLLAEMLKLKKDQRERLVTQAKAELANGKMKATELESIQIAFGLADDLSSLIMKYCGGAADFSSMIEASALIGAIVVGISDGTGMEPTERLIDLKRSKEENLKEEEENLH